MLDLPEKGICMFTRTFVWYLLAKDQTKLRSTQHTEHKFCTTAVQYIQSGCSIKKWMTWMGLGELNLTS